MAGRPRTPIGSWGNITVRETNTGHEARARYRTRTGTLKLISARATSKTAARARLMEKLTQYREAEGHSGITRHTTTGQLLQRWLADKTDVLPQTIDDYRQTITHDLTPQLGAITLEELTPGLIAAHLNTLPKGTYTRARSILTQALALALSHDAIPANPVTGLPRPRKTAPTVVIFPLDDLATLRTRIEKWINAEIDDNGHPTTPKTRQKGRAHQLGQFLDLLLATGCRTGELAAAQWHQFNTNTNPPTFTVNATMVWRKEHGLIRQTFTKTKLIRVLTLPPFAVTTLNEIKETTPYTQPTDPVFYTADGTHRDPAAIQRQWRRARKAAGYPNAELRTMRRTVATLIERQAGDTYAAQQLGHTTTAMTQRHYIAAQAQHAPDLTAILQSLATQQTDG